MTLQTLQMLLTEMCTLGAAEPTPIGSRLEDCVDDFLIAQPEGETFTTTPVVSTGRKLVLNYATSAAGRLRAEITDSLGVPLPGFDLDNCLIFFDDRIAAAVIWSDDPNRPALMG